MPGSVLTVKPSGETVVLPSIESRPVVWSKVRKLSWVPGGALNMFGNVIGRGVANDQPPAPGS